MKHLTRILIIGIVIDFLLLLREDGHHTFFQKILVFITQMLILIGFLAIWEILANANIIDINSLGQNNNFVSKKISQESLVNVLNSQQVDGVIVRSILAEKLITEGDKYKIVYKAQASPGHMVLLNPKVDSAKEEQFRNIFLSLNNLDKNSIALKAIDGHQPGTTVFKAVSAEDIKLSNDVFKKTKQIPLAKNSKN